LHTYYYLNSEKRLKTSLSNELSKSIEIILLSYLDKLKSNNDAKYNAFANAISLIKARSGLPTTLI
jgi:hypothetical protein